MTSRDAANGGILRLMPKPALPATARRAGTHPDSLLARTMARFAAGHCATHHHAAGLFRSGPLAQRPRRAAVCGT